MSHEAACRPQRVDVEDVGTEAAGFVIFVTSGVDVHECVAEVQCIHLVFAAESVVPVGGDGGKTAEIGDREMVTKATMMKVALLPSAEPAGRNLLRCGSIVGGILYMF
ncbi:hypothetical protein PI124_g24135 [Phytophthora idaei]|nr:hypothetical protein PI125_g26497 [Phytophthora idaei]KAG3122294.1 hypothetical protein PI126_g24210 [Phytophthora idaei]KAG3230767.1 hypothetical protein PI124_g24135 [Phytophthora idaei]